MKNKSQKTPEKIFYKSLTFCLVCFFSFTVAAQQPDKTLLDKYGLVIPPAEEKISPAPQWLQKADMFTFDFAVYKNRQFIIKDTLVKRIVRTRAEYGVKDVLEHYPFESIDGFDGELIKGVPLFTQSPHCKDAYDGAHKNGIRAIPYVHFSDIHSFYADQDVFFWEHPEILIKDDKGRWLHMPMDGSSRAFRFMTCPNSPSYWKLSLAYIKKQMDMGADGIFFDNVGKPQICHAMKFNNSARNPEFPTYTHEHLFPEATDDYAWEQLIIAIRALVKSYGDDKIVLLNSGIGTQYQKYGDCCEWESFIYSWAWKGRNDTWADVKKRARENEWILKEGKRITAKSFLSRQTEGGKDDAFWAFSAARLVDFIWWAELSRTNAAILYQAHMGNGLEPFKEINGLAYRAYDNGVIVLNDSETDQSVELTLPANFLQKKLMDLFNDSQIIQVRNKKIKVTVPKQCARVYVSGLNL